MPWTGGTLTPAEVAGLYCPRCWFPAPMIPLGVLTYRCGRCEWLFTAGAPTVAAPAVPSSGTATTNLVANTTGTVVAVTISAGTLTNVFVNGVSAGTTDGTYLVPVAGTISITYSVAPTWTWTLPVTNAAVTAGGSALPFAAGGTAYAVGQILIIDPAGTPDVVTVNGTPTGTSVPVTTLNASHGSGVHVTVAVASPEFSAIESVPQTSY